MTPDLTEDPAGRAGAFATACVSTFVFIRNFVMKPAIKSCQQRCTDLEDSVNWLKAQIVAKDMRIGQLETVLLTCGIPELRKKAQEAISEVRVEIDKLEGKL